MSKLRKVKIISPIIFTGLFSWVIHNSGATEKEGAVLDRIKHSETQEQLIVDYMLSRTVAECKHIESDLLLLSNIEVAKKDASEVLESTSKRIAEFQSNVHKLIDSATKSHKKFFQKRFLISSRGRDIFKDFESATGSVSLAIDSAYGRDTSANPFTEGEVERGDVKKALRVAKKALENFMTQTNLRLSKHSPKK